MSKISVIIPVQNVESYIGQCLDSILNQKIEDIQIIVINDNSTDDTKQIVQKYLDIYGNIQLINTNGVGPGAARNIGLQASSGDYIAFVDGDDYISKYMYFGMCKEILKNNLDIIICDFEHTYDNYICNNDINNDEDIDKIDILTNEHAIRKFLKGDIGTYSWNKVYRRTLLSDFNIHFSENCSTSEDILFTVMALSNAKKIGLVSNKFYKYRKREGSITSHLTKEKIYDHSQELAKTINYLSKQSRRKNDTALVSYFVKEAISIFLNLCITLKFNRKIIYQTFNTFYNALDLKLTIWSILKNNNLNFFYKIRYIMLKYRVLDLYFYIRFKVHNRLSN